MKSNTNGFGRPTDSMFNKLDPIQAVQRAFEILFSNPCTFVCAGLLFIVPVFVAAFVVVLPIMVATADLDGAAGAGDTQSPAAFALMVVLLYFLCIPFLFLSTAATIRATAEVYAGETPEMGRIVRVGWRNICRLFCFGLVLAIPLLGLLLLGLAIFGLMMAFSEPDGSISSTGLIIAMMLYPLWLALYLYMMIPFQMAPPSLVLERIALTDVVSRAWELSSGRRFTIFSAMFVLGLANALMGFIPFVNLFWHLIALPLTSILATVLFISLRVEKEGLNCGGLRGELGLDLEDDTETELVTDKYVDVPSMDGKHEMV